MNKREKTHLGIMEMAALCLNVGEDCLPTSSDIVLEITLLLALNLWKGAQVLARGGKRNHHMTLFSYLAVNQMLQVQTDVF